MRLNKSTIRLLDLIAVLLWGGAIIMLIADTLLFRYHFGLTNADRDIAKIWMTALFASAIMVSVWAAASWTVRKFEESLDIAENVHSIQTELEAMRERRERRELVADLGRQRRQQNQEPARQS